MRRSSSCVLIAALLLAACASNQGPAPVEDHAAAAPLAVAPAPNATTSQTKPEPPSKPDQPGFHTVRKGETLYHIAQENGQSAKDLAAWNNLSEPQNITVGQQLRIIPPGSTIDSNNVLVTPLTPRAPITEAPANGANPLIVDGLTDIKTAPLGGKQPYSLTAFSAILAANKVATANPSDAQNPVNITSPPSPPTPAGVTSPPLLPTPGQAAASNKPGNELNWMWPAPSRVTTAYSEASKGIEIAGKVGDPVLAVESGKVVYVGSALRAYGNLIIISHNPTYLSAYGHSSKILVKEGDQVKRGQKIAEFGMDGKQVRLHFEIRRNGKPIDPLPLLPTK